MDAFIGAERVRIPFPDGEWIEVKQELTQEDEDAIASEMLSASNTGGSTAVQIKAGRLALLARGVVAWSFAGTDGKPIPLTRDNLSCLRARYRQPTLAKLDALTASALEFVRKN